MSKMFKDLKTSLKDAVAHKKGKLNLRSETIEIPEPPTDYKKKEIKQIRISLSCSQGIFAKILNVSVKTVQSWESGQRTPHHAALRLIELIDKGVYRPEFYKKR